MQTTPKARIDAYRKNGWWRGVTINTLMQAAVEKRGEAEALIDPPNRAALIGDAPQRLSFLQVEERVVRMAKAFRRLGVGRDDIVLVQIPNVIEGVIAFLACARIGAILSPVSMAFRANELRSIAQRLKPSLYLTVEVFHDFNYLAMARELTDAGALQAPIATIGGGARQNALDIVEGGASGDALDAADVDAADILTICWTSGTEAEPKGVPRHHDHWVVNGEAMLEAVNLDEGDVILNPFPLVNIAAFGGMVVPWLLTGGKFVQHHPFDLKIFLEQLQGEGVNYTIAPPAILTMLLKQKELLDGADFSALKAIASGSAPLPPFMVKGWQEQYGVAIMNVFGSNEGCSLFSSANDIPDPEDRARYFPRFGVEGVEWPSQLAKKIRTKLVSLDDESEIKIPGCVGELRISGAMAFDGYWNADALNKNAFDEDGYFKTGDLFQIADGGSGRYYEFVGRSKEIIIRGGVNISPAELDALIESHPDVQEAACVAYPDERLGERVCAIVAMKSGEPLTLESLSEYLQEKQISTYKLPEKLHLIDALPRNGMGKVMRRELSALAAR